MSSSQIYYIYMYLDPRKPGRYSYKNISFLYEPIYIGKGKGKRYLMHLKYFEKHKNKYFKNKINKIIKQGFSKQDIENKILILTSNLEEQKAFNIEKSLIKEIGCSYLYLGPLINLTEGGEGKSGCIASLETRNKMSKVRTGKKFSEETKRKISESNRRRTFSKETKEKISKSNKGKSVSEETRKKISISNKGKIAHNFGKKLSEETKQKMSKVFSGEKNPMFGKKHSKETKQKISKILITKKLRQGENNSRHKLNLKDVICIKMLFKLGFNVNYINRYYCNIQKQNIYHIKYGLIWKFVKI